MSKGTRVWTLVEGLAACCGVVVVVGGYGPVPVGGGGWVVFIARLNLVWLSFVIVVCC